jgi:hypothetical protein
MIVSKIDMLHKTLKKGYYQVVSSKFAKPLFFSIILVAIARLLIYTYLYSVNILYWDEWGFYGAFINNLSAIELFDYQFGPHKQGLGFLITKIIDTRSNWNTRYISFASSGMLVITAFIYLLLKKRLSGKLHFFDFLIVLIVLTPAQFSLFSGVPNLSHGPMPSLLLALFCLTLTIKKQLIRNILLIVIHFNLLFSGFGLVISVITPFLFLGDLIFHLKKKEVRQTAVSFTFLVFTLISVYIFLINYHIEQGQGFLLLDPIQSWQYIYFAAISYLNFYFSSVQYGFVGFIILTPILYVFFKQFITLIKHFQKWNSHQLLLSKIILILSGYSLTFVFTSALGRAHLGLEFAHASRYICYLVPSVLALYLYLDSIKKNKAFFTIVFTAFVCFSLVSRKDMKRIAEGKREWKAAYLKSEDITKATELSGFEIYPLEKKEELALKLDYLKKNKLNLFIGSHE